MLAVVACGGDDDAAPAPEAPATTVAPAAATTAPPPTAAPPPPTTASSDGSLAACAGTYTGSYVGDLEGGTSGTLDAAGQFQFSFAGEASGAGDGTVGSDLAFDGSTKVPGTNLPSAVLDGALDLTTCSISGTWQALGTGDGGTYEFTRS